MIKEEVTIPIYYGSIILILVDDLTELNEEYNIDFTRGSGAGVFTKITDTGTTDHIVAFDNDWDYDLIAHECVHLVNDIFIDRRIKLDPNNDEPQAYLMGWVFRQCEQFLNKHKIMEKEIWKFQVWLGSEIVLETMDKEEAVKTFNNLPSGSGQPASKRRGLTQVKTLLEDGE